MEHSNLQARESIAKVMVLSEHDGKGLLPEGK